MPAHVVQPQLDMQRTEIDKTNTTIVTMALPAAVVQLVRQNHQQQAQHQTLTEQQQQHQAHHTQALLLQARLLLLQAVQKTGLNAGS
jgi:hypothetical protein